MKKPLVILIALLLSPAVWAQSPPPSYSMQPPPPPPPPRGGGLEDARQRMLQRVDDRMHELEGVRNCILQARDREGLKQCRPQRPEGPPNGAGQPPQGGQRGGQQGDRFP